MDDTDVRSGGRGGVGLPANHSGAQAVEESIRVAGLSNPPTRPVHRPLRRISAPRFVSFLDFVPISVSNHTYIALIIIISAIWPFNRNGVSNFLFFGHCITFGFPN